MGIILQQQQLQEEDQMADAKPSTSSAQNRKNFPFEKKELRSLAINDAISVTAKSRLRDSPRLMTPRFDSFCRTRQKRIG